MKPKKNNNNLISFICKSQWLLEYVNVITIDGEDSTHNLHAGEVGTFVGFGKTTDVSNTSPVLNEIDDILIITQELCKYTYGLLLHAGEVIYILNLNSGSECCRFHLVFQFEKKNRFVLIQPMEKVLVV